MPDTLYLRLVTPERLLLDEEVDEVTAPGVMGEFGVLPNHITFLATLEAGRLTYKQGGQIRRLAVSGGFAEVVDNVITVLADTAEFAEEIDMERARIALQQAQEQIKDLSPFSPEFAGVQGALKRAEARIQVVGQ